MKLACSVVAALLVMALTPAPASAQVSISCKLCLPPRVGDLNEDLMETSAQHLGGIRVSPPLLPTGVAVGAAASAWGETRKSALETKEERSAGVGVVVTSEAGDASAIPRNLWQPPPEGRRTADDAAQSLVQLERDAKTELQRCYTTLQAVNGATRAPSERLGVSTTISWNQAGCGAIPASTRGPQQDSGSGLAGEVVLSDAAASLVRAGRAPVGPEEAALAVSIVPWRDPDPAANRVALQDAPFAFTESPRLGMYLALAAALAILVAALYRRLSRQAALDQPTRIAILGFVSAEPGVTAQRIARHLGIHHRAVAHHLEVLREFGILEARRVGARLRYFRNGAVATDTEKRARVALSSGKAAGLMRVLVEFPDVSTRELARRTALAESTVRWHVERLEQLGLLCAGRIPPEATEAVRRVVERSAP